MKSISDHELKQIQMDVLSAIDEFCSERGIKYSLSSGTLLGAVRHKGYIPWDDDIDILLYRTEYDRLVSEFPELYRGKYMMKSLERDCSYDRPYSIIYDDTTIFMEGADIWGIKVDVFPIDDVPDNEAEWLKYNKKRKRLQTFFNYTSMNKGANWIQSIVFKGIHLFTKIYSRRRLAKKLDHFSKKYNGKGYHRCFENAAGYHFRTPFEKTLFNNLTLYPFEDRQYFGLKDSDSYLRACYGDYMKLPPESERVTHHNFKVYWK